MKQMEAAASQTADTAKAVKDVISALLNLLNAVNKNEIDTNAQIFRGI